MGRGGRSRRAAGRAGLCHSQTSRARLSPLGQAAAGAGRRNKERASRRAVGRFWQPRCRVERWVGTAGCGAVKLISPWVLRGEEKAEGVCGGAASSVLGEVPGQRGERVPWRPGRRLGPWPAARGAGEGRCERSLCRYITFCCEHPQENQPASPERGSLFGFFFFFLIFFSFPPASTFSGSCRAPSLPPALPAAGSERPPGTPGARGTRGFHTPV